MQIVINIDEVDYEMLKVLKNCGGRLHKSDLRILDGTPLPNKVTNGDIIKIMFPSVKVKEKNNGYEVYFGIGTAVQYFNHQWWGSPYQEERGMNYAS